MDTDSFYLALAEKELEDCFRLEMRADRQSLRSNDCVNSFTANAVASFFACPNTNNIIRETLASSRNKSDVHGCYVAVVSKTCYCYDITSD